MKTIKVLIADSQVLIREGIRALLTNNPGISIVAEVTEGKDLIPKIKKFSPDVILIDFNLPGFFEVKDIEQVYKEFPNANVLVVTSNHTKKDIQKVLDYGVNNYILKECDKEEIVNAIYATAKKEKFFCGKVIDAILDKHFPKNEHCEPTVLSIRETEVVKLISEGHTNKKIALQLFLSVHTVNTHRKNIFKKLKIKNSSELVLFAIANGIIDTPGIKSLEQRNYA